VTEKQIIAVHELTNSQIDLTRLDLSLNFTVTVIKMC